MEPFRKLDSLLALLALNLFVWLGQYWYLGLATGLVAGCIGVRHMNDERVGRPWPMPELSPRATWIVATLFLALIGRGCYLALLPLF